MRDRTRTLITLLIAPDSPLAKGRMPLGAAEEEKGIKACFDPVSTACQPGRVYLPAGSRGDVRRGDTEPGNQAR